MDFNLVSKNNLGAVTALLLVVILSQGRFFNFLLDTALGRAILILFILFILSVFAMLYCYILFIILFICGLVRWVYTCLKIMICDGDGWRV